MNNFSKQTNMPEEVVKDVIKKINYQKNMQSGVTNRLQRWFYKSPRYINQRKNPIMTKNFRFDIEEPDNVSLPDIPEFVIDEFFFRLQFCWGLAYIQTYHPQWICF